MWDLVSKTSQLRLNYLSHCEFRFSIIKYFILVWRADYFLHKWLDFDFIFVRLFEVSTSFPPLRESIWKFWIDCWCKHNDGVIWCEGKMYLNMTDKWRGKYFRFNVSLKQFFFLKQKGAMCFFNKLEEKSKFYYMHYYVRITAFVNLN